MIPISEVRLPAEVEQLVNDVLRSGRLAQGPMVKRFETEFAELCDVTHAIAVNSGTTALVAALQALDIGPGDEVITSPFTFVATINAIIEAGATVVFADVNPSDALMDITGVENVCSERTRAVMPVHLYGQMADVSLLSGLASRLGLRVIEDAAQAHLARRDGRIAGSWDVGCFSMYATKNLTTAEGGMITTSDDRLAEVLRTLRNQGMRNRYEYLMAGNNYRMTDVHAAIGLGQLGALRSWTARRQENAARLLEGLQRLPGIELLTVHENSEPVFHQFTVRVTSAAAISRDGLVSRLAEAGIGSGVYYPRAVYDYECYRSHALVDTTPQPNAERLASEVVSLPVHPHLGELDLERVIETVSGALDG